jgi:putative transcriptional regulator
LCLWGNKTLPGLGILTVIPNLFLEKGVVRLILSARMKKGFINRFLSLSLLFFLTLQVTLILCPDSRAESSGAAPAKLQFKAAIPRQDSDEPGAREELAKGKFLVASRRLIDSNFQETVVLLIEYGMEGAMGLVINRPSQVKLAKVFPDISELGQREDPVYLGGPVAVNQVLMLIGSPKTPQGSIPVIPDVYLSSSLEELKRLIKNADKDERFRIFAGYSGWAPSQLDFERARGDWHVLKADAETIFAKNSSEIWPELIRRATVKWVRAKGPVFQ